MQSEAGAAGALHGALKAGAFSTTFTASNLEQDVMRDGIGDISLRKLWVFDGACWCHGCLAPLGIRGCCDSKLFYKFIDDIL